MEQQNNKMEKLTDKAFSRVLVTSVISILLCLVFLCSATYAWFAESVPSENNEIKAAEECALKVTLADGTQTLLEADCSEAKTLSLSGGTYTVQLSLPADSASGYLLIKVGTEKYHTAYIARHTDTVVHTVTFDLVVVDNGADVDVTFEPRWGIYSGDCSVEDGGQLTID